jgi:hypothetical protein
MAGYAHGAVSPFPEDCHVLARGEDRPAVRISARIRVNGGITTRWASRKGPSWKGFKSFIGRSNMTSHLDDEASECDEAPERSGEDACKDHALELFER